MKTQKSRLNPDDLSGERIELSKKVKLTALAWDSIVL
jgi:hypothetical protein